MTLNSIAKQIADFFTEPGTVSALKAALAALGGIFLSRVVPRMLPVGRLHPQHQMVVKKIVRYAIFLTGLGWALSLLGVSLQLLLGAAGILTVAIGFAAQTSASNLISGLFLMAEQPFRIGDVVKLGEVTGTIVSIELLSFRLRTFDNVEVRIPNETMLKSNVTNLTKYAIRRYDLVVEVAYKEDLPKVKALFQEVADEIPTCLTEPKPQAIFLGFEASGVKLQLSVWATKENFFTTKAQFAERIKSAFDKNGIEIPFPHRTYYTGSRTEPFPIKVTLAKDDPLKEVLAADNPPKDEAPQEMDPTKTP